MFMLVHRKFGALGSGIIMKSCQRDQFVLSFVEGAYRALLIL